MMTHYKLHEKRTEEGLDALFGRGRGKRSKQNNDGNATEKSGRSSSTNLAQNQNRNQTGQVMSPIFAAHPANQFYANNSNFPQYNTNGQTRSPYTNTNRNGMSPFQQPM